MKKRTAFFVGFCIENGRKRRLSRREIAECWRLWAKHRDIREGKPERWGGLPLGEEQP
jgi:hypothetical protein